MKYEASTRQSMIDNIVKLEPSLTVYLLDQLSYTTLMQIENDLVDRNMIWPKTENNEEV